MNYDSLLTTLVRKGTDDWVQAADVVWIVKSKIGPQADEKEIRNHSIMLVRKALIEGLVDVCDVRIGEGFVSWGINPTEAIDRIEREWVS